jgi:thermitase
LGDLFAALAKAVVGLVLAVQSMIAGAVPAVVAAQQSAPAQASVAAPSATPLAQPKVSHAVSGRLLVRYRAGTTNDAADQLERAHGAAKNGDIRQLGVRVLQVPEGSETAVLHALAADPRVEFAERDQTVAITNTTPNDYWWPSQWSQVKTRTNVAWDLTAGSSSVVIAVLDTGIDLSQPDLQGKLVAGYNVLRGGADPADDNGHGTWAAGVAGAASNNSIGVASYCWRCSLMPVKVLGADGSGTMSNVAAGITWASDRGARVISMSLAGTTGTSTLQSAVQYAHAHGVVLVAASGNYGNASPTYPAAYPEVLSVAGSDPNDALYSWSDYGSWVKLAAPGCNYTTGRSGWYGSFCGTSAATPAVAGIAGLAFSYAPTTSNTMVESAIESSAVKLGSAVTYGRVDAYGTLLALGAPAASGSPSPTMTPAPSAAPSPTATPTASPSPSPTLAPTPSPTSMPAPAPLATATTTFSGAVTTKNNSRAFSLATGSGNAAATLTFSKASPLTLTVYGSDGAVLGTQTGASPLAVSVALSVGSVQFVVSGTAQSSFTLTVNYASP